MKGSDRQIFVMALILSLLIVGINNPVCAQNNTIENQGEECTIGVASARSTSDGKPLLWKTRDYKNDYNTIFYIETEKYGFISNITPEYGFDKVWMGLNEKGFAIINSLSSDLKKDSTGPGNGELMYYALSTCASVEEFQKLLDSTNISGRQTNANFGVIDTTGAAVMYETSGNQYWKFDANDTIQSPEGYVLRTNFAFNGGGRGGKQRFNRTQKLIKDFSEGDSLSHKTILRYQMRDLVDDNNQPVLIPWENKQGEAPKGYLNCNNSICRPSSIATAVFHGVRPSETARYGTMWVITGQPATSVALPYWATGYLPKLVSHPEKSGLVTITGKLRSLLFDTRNKNLINTNKLSNKNGNGLWNYTFKTEDRIFNATDIALKNWQSSGASSKQMFRFSKKQTRIAYKTLKRAYRNMLRYGI